MYLMRNSFSYIIRAVDERDHSWVVDLITAHWGGDFIVIHGDLITPHLLPGFIAEKSNSQAVGLVTYQVHGEVCEIITLNSLVENQGVGSKLVEAVLEEARNSGCSRLCLTTTNDNQRAIEFYKNRGFRLREIREGAVTRAREIKPTIPELSPEGVPICDEWEFELILSRID